MGGVCATSLSGPQAVALDQAENLYVCDSNNARVLFFLAGSPTATRVYGQLDSFATNLVNKGGMSADSLGAFPRAVVVDTFGNLYVTDVGNNRVLFYQTGSTTATRVYGQLGSFTTASSNKGGISADSLDSPFGLAFDSVDNLFVSDYINNRVLVFPPGRTSATFVFGQGGSFSSSLANNGGIGPQSLQNPLDVAVGNDGVYIAGENICCVVVVAVVVVIIFSTANRFCKQSGVVLSFRSKPRD